METQQKFYNNLYVFITLILLFLYVYELNYYRHWSTTYDQDLILIHNSLLLNSGIKAEYHDHPGHTLILIISLWLSFLDLINLINFSSYQGLNASENLENDFKSIVIFSRFINLFIGILFIFTLTNFLKIFNINKLSSFLIILFFITSSVFLIPLSHIRTEFLSSCLIFLALLYQLKLIRKNTFKRKYLFLMGFFFTLSLFCKFQSIFIYVLFPLIITIFENKKIDIKLKKYEKKITNYLTFIFILFIFLIWFKYVKGINFILLPFFLFYLFIYLNYLNKRFFLNHNFIKLFIFYNLSGIAFSFILLVIFKPFHTNNISMIINFLGAGSMFVQGSNLYTSNFLDIYNLLLISLNNFVDYLIRIIQYFKFDYLILSILNIYIYFLNFKSNHIKIKLLSYFFCIFFVLFIFSVRTTFNYLIYLSPLVIIYFSSVSKKFPKNLLNLILTILITINLSNSYQFVSKKKYNNEKNVLCSKLYINQLHFFTQKLNDEVIIKLCK